MGSHGPDFSVATERHLLRRLWQGFDYSGAWLLRLIEAGFLWYGCRRQRARQRRMLASYDDHLLKDIGLSRADVEDELTKGFWRD